MIRTLAMAAMMWLPTSALAGFTAVVDLGQTVDSHYEQDLGLRAGYTISLVNLHVTPEVSQRLLLVDSDTAMGTFIGGRASLGFLIAPGIYANTGVWTNDQTTSSTGGMTLDFRGVPMSIFGLHAGYTMHDKGNFLSYGLHAGLEF